ncbi:MAG: glycosyltransferase family 4 protein, partial [Leptolyngbya sp. SIO3F4]|nr:glycosyltransferase family 4 protein [Leptolyngbya sp. SIO3F4]
NHFGLWELKSEDSELKSEDSELKSEDYIGYELEKVAGNLSIIDHHLEVHPSLSTDEYGVCSDSSELMALKCSPERNSLKALNSMSDFSGKNIESTFSSPSADCFEEIKDITSLSNSADLIQPDKKSLVNLPVVSSSDENAIERIHNDFSVEHLKEAKDTKTLSNVELANAESVQCDSSSSTTLPTGALVDEKKTESICFGDEPTVLWFGNHGAKYGKFGMLNILELSEVLEELYKELNFNLLVVSNNYQKYLDHIAVLNISSSYLEWHPTQIYDYISASDVVIIPNSKTDFSICKSANRAILALSLNVPVVATRTPALELFESSVIFDDWEYGLRSYLSNKSMTKEHVQKAQAVIQQNYSGSVIAQQWMNLLQQVKR